MNKTAGHVGIVFSFIIFVTFLIFLYDALAPVIQTTEDKENLLKDVKDKIIDKFYSNLTVTTIEIIGSVSGSNCIQIEKSDISTYSNFFVKFINETDVNLEQTGAKINIPYTPGFFKIFSTDEQIISGTDSCNNPTASDKNSNYKIILVRPQRQIFSALIESIINDMEEDSKYQDLKDSLGIPIDTEFSIGFEYSNGSKIGGSDIDASINIYVDKVAVTYVVSQANIKPGFVEFTLW